MRTNYLVIIFAYAILLTACGGSGIGSAGNQPTPDKPGQELTVQSLQGNQVARVLYSLSYPYRRVFRLLCCCNLEDIYHHLCAKP